VLNGIAIFLGGIMKTDRVPEIEPSLPSLAATRNDRAISLIDHGDHSDLVKRYWKDLSLAQRPTVRNSTASGQ